MSTRESPFPAVPGGYPFPRLELEVLERWRRDDVFRRSVAQSAGRPEWVFYEGPPTANNVPHVGHVVTRVVKDLFPRYRTMRGFHVARKAGWDTHGLAVEIEVEKQLGFSGKGQIEEYGIAEFNKACLESVHSYERQWRAMTERVGYWTDLDNAYYTYANVYIESVWWSLQQLWRQGLLVQDYKIQPYCARCGTTLSSHEVAQNYKDVDDPSVWVLFPARPGQEVATVDGPPLVIGDETAFVAWTTTPWTLTAHVALVAHPEMVYRVVEHPTKPGHRLIFGDALEKPVPLEVDAEGGKRKRLDLRDLRAIASVRGRDLEGLRYDRPYRVGNPDRVSPEPWPAFADLPPSDENGWRVLLAGYVTATDGTGIVHTSLPFGEDDYATGQRYRLPFYLTVDGQGKIANKPGLEAFAGMWFKDADPFITKDVKSRGLLLHGERYKHNYPFCWRCDTPLLYYASLVWFIRTTQRRDSLVAHNKTIDWHPPTIGEGRFGNWLENVVDWALSRKRYWGTPLPVWQCDKCGVGECIGSYDELFAKSRQPRPADVYDRASFDPHRPFIDAVTWRCAADGCEGTMSRVEEVIDAWYDAGSMPFAQHHYMGEPLAELNPNPLHGERRGFPADWISEAVDQTRGWFYTLHVLGVLLFDSVAYESCVVLGFVTDEQGRKMSKRLRNVVEPMGVIEETGADALRWYFYVNNPEQSSRFSAALVREAAQRFLLPLWNALSFFTIYANLDGWHPGRSAVPLGERAELDRWILLRLDELVEQVTRGLDTFEITGSARLIEGFIDDLTNWYIRRSRARFWGALATTATKEAAYQTLYEVLTTLSRLIAPFTPFLADVLHDHLVRSQDAEATDSVHLESWPQPRGHAGVLGPDALELNWGMDLAKGIVGLGRAARNTHELKTRQPLASATVVAPPRLASMSFAGGPESPSGPYTARLFERFRPLISEELNVKSIALAENRADFVRQEVRPNFRVLGKRLGPLTPKVKAALEQADGDALAAALEEKGAIALDLDGQRVELSRDELEVRLEEKPGLATAGDRELLVALDTALTPELMAEGWAREVVHRIQAARKDMNLDYADRIGVRYQADEELAAAIAAHGEWIAGETLAVAMDAVDGDAASALTAAPIDGHEFAFTIERT